MTDKIWQPIETAPKDGARILVYNPATGSYSTEYHAGEFPLFIQSGMVGLWYPVPTHWMPLPEAPEKA